MGDHPFNYNDPLAEKNFLMRLEYFWCVGILLYLVYIRELLH